MKFSTVKIRKYLKDMFSKVFPAKIIEEERETEQKIITYILKI